MTVDRVAIPDMNAEPHIKNKTEIEAITAASIIAREMLDFAASMVKVPTHVRSSPS